MSRRSAMFLFLLLVAPAAWPENTTASPRVDAQQGAVPAAVNRAFLGAVLVGDVDSIMPFLPRAQVVTWIQTVHERGSRRVEVRRYTRERARGEITSGELRGSLASNMHSARVGSLSTQVIETGDEWVRVNRMRFVPPGSTDSGATYVQWRREGSRWVVSSFGDEAYTDVPVSTATEVRPRL